ncbi:MAG: hypothetical protein HY075_08610 [Deltaproteobacteria bacterium]|nr:hypothetical protein [Deltaproteobacteria bacterium]
MKTQILFALLSLTAADLTPASAADCTNFTGAWAGTCVTNGQTTHDEMGVQQQGCQAVNLGGQNVIMGRSTTDTRVSDGVVITTVISADWNPVRSEIVGKYVIIQRPLQGQGERYVALDTNVKLESGKLVVAARGEGIDARCSYEKRQ